MFKSFKPRWKELEKELIQNLAIRKFVHVKEGKLYYLTNERVMDEPEHVFIAIHGTAGTSIDFLSLLQYLPPRSLFLFIDLPGFGKSHTTQPDPTLAHYVDWIREFMDKLGMDKARFIAHSFGTVFATEFAHLHPDRVESLTLISPANLLPTLSYNGVWYALLFKLRFPYIFRWFRLVIYLLFHMRLLSKKEAHSWSCIIDRKSTMGQLVSQRITVGWFGGYCNAPIMGKLLALSIPITVVFGEHDTLSPKHSAWVFYRLRPDIRIEVINGEGHNPICKASKLIVQCALRTPEHPNAHPNAHHVSHILSKPELYISSYWFHPTWKVIEKLYHDLTKIKN